MLQRPIGVVEGEAETLVAQAGCSVFIGVEVPHLCSKTIKYTFTDL